jgi:hypothetical protein
MKVKILTGDKEKQEAAIKEEKEKLEGEKKNLEEKQKKLKENEQLEEKDQKRLTQISVRLDLIVKNPNKLTHLQLIKAQIALQPNQKLAIGLMERINWLSEKLTGKLMVPSGVLQDPKDAASVLAHSIYQAALSHKVANHPSYSGYDGVSVDAIISRAKSTAKQSKKVKFKRNSRFFFQNNQNSAKLKVACRMVGY